MKAWLAVRTKMLRRFADVEVDRESPELHERLVDHQPEEELRRKARKARSKHRRWQQEQFDLANRRADQLWRFFNGMPSREDEGLPR